MFEIISADSVQVYRYLDVGSGKLSVADRMGIPHHLIDEVHVTKLTDLRARLLIRRS